MGSFIKAAHALELPRATVSAAVQQLETQIGARLLHRTTRQVSLTVDGTLVLARAQAHGETVAPPEGDAARDWLSRAGELLDETGAELWRPMWRALCAGARAGAAI